MTVRARYALSFSVSSTSAEEKDLGNVKWEVVSDASGEGGIRKNVVPVSATDVPLDMGNVSNARLLLVRTNSKDPTLDPVEIQIRRNTVFGELWPIVPLTSAKEGHLLISTSGLTALYATNVGGVEMEVTIGLVGD